MRATCLMNRRCSHEPQTQISRRETGRRTCADAETAVSGLSGCGHILEQDIGKKRWVHVSWIGGSFYRESTPKNAKGEGVLPTSVIGFVALSIAGLLVRTLNPPVLDSRPFAVKSPGFRFDLDRSTDDGRRLGVHATPFPAASARPPTTIRQNPIGAVLKQSEQQ